MQMQKNKSGSEESDIETEKVTDGYEGEEIGRITAILIGIFDEMKDLNNDMKKITSENRELRKLVGAWENLWRDERHSLKIRRTRE